MLVDSSSFANNRTQNTASDNEDSGGQSGWSIADGSVYRNRDNTGGWTDFGESKKIAIKGYAKAQPPLVSNTGQDNAGVINVSFDEFAQAFGTGSHTAGYDLASIVLSLGFAPTGTGTLTVTVREDASGDPSGTALHTLTTPDPFAADALNADRRWRRRQLRHAGVDIIGIGHIGPDLRRQSRIGKSGSPIDRRGRRRQLQGSGQTRNNRSQSGPRARA